MPAAPHADPSVFDQRAYQVRMDSGVEGLRRLAASDVIVVVDVLRFSTTVTDAAARGDTLALADAHAVSINGAAIAGLAGALRGADGGPGPLVLVGSLRNRTAVARAILREQVRRGARTSIAVIAAGELASRALGAPLRFAVEDQLGAGAVIDALADLGIDHSSPDAAVAGESFRALRRAVGHLLSASGSARELAQSGRGADIAHAAEVDVETAVAVLRADGFRPLV